MNYITTRGKLTEKEARKFFRQIVSALIHIHEANVVHRDLKLENILLNQNKDCLISDFGLGRSIKDDEYLKTFCGTPNYASYELVAGIPYDGVKSDIWALGVILYIMVAGKRPFSGSTISVLYQKILTLNYEIPSSFSPELVNLLRKIFVKDPEKRIDLHSIRRHEWLNIGYQTMVELYPQNDSDNHSVGKKISSIHNDYEFTVYTLNTHFKTRISISNSEDSFASRRRSSITLRKSSHVQTMGPSSTNNFSAPRRASHDNPLHRRSSSFFENSLNYFKRSKTDSYFSNLGGSNEVSVSRRHSHDQNQEVCESPPSNSEDGFKLSNLDQNEQAPNQLFKISSRIKMATPFENAIKEEAEGETKSKLEIDTKNNRSRRNTLVRRRSFLARRISFSKDVEAQTNDPKHSLSLPNSTSHRQEPVKLRRRANTITGIPSTKSTHEKEERITHILDEDSGHPLDQRTTNKKSLDSLLNSPVDVKRPSIIPSVEEITRWHEIHKPPKIIRTVKMPFGKGTFSYDLEPAKMFSDLYECLESISEMEKEHFNLNMKRIPEFYLLLCDVEFLDGRSNLIFEAEVNKLWLIKVHGIRLRKIQGDGFDFKTLYSQIVEGLCYTK